MKNFLSNNLAVFSKVLIFLFLEITAVLAFSLGNSFIFSTILIGVIFLLSLLVLFVTFKQIDKDEVSSFAIFLFPLFIFGLLTALSNFAYDPAFVLLGNAKYLIPIAFILFAGTGYLFSTIKTFNIKYFFFVFYISLGVYVLINFFVTLIQFSPFYTIKYADFYMYYDGVKSSTPVGGMAYALMGFSFEEVSIEYYMMFPSLLLTCIIPLIFLKYKENRKIFTIYLVLFSLGIINIILFPTKMGIINFVLVGLAITFLLLSVKKIIPLNAIKYIAIVGGAIFVILFVVFVLNAQNYYGTPITFIRDIISGNAFLDRLFNSNRFSSAYTSVLDGIFTSDRLFGTFTYPMYYSPYYDCIMPTGNFFVDTFMVSGVFGFLFFAAFVGLCIYRLYLYMKNSDDTILNKTMLLGFIIVLFTYSIFSYDVNPMIFKDNLSPLFISNYFLLAIFLVSYIFGKSFSVGKNEDGTQNTDKITIIKGGKEDEFIEI